MYLTRSMLAALHLDEATTDAVLQAHQAAVDKLRKGWEKELAEAATLREAAQERDSLQNEIDRLKKEGERADRAEAALNDHKAQQAAEMAAREREKLVHTALENAGVSQKIMPLLMTAIDMEHVQVENGALVNESDMIGEIRSKWPACFTAVKPEPAGGAHELRGETGFTRDDLSLMTTEEINRHWPSVQEALRGW